MPGRGRGQAGGGPHGALTEWVTSALQDLEPQQLLLFVQSFGIPVSSMSKLLQCLDQAVAHDPQTLEQNIMDKSKGRGPRTSGQRLEPGVCGAGLGTEEQGEGTEP